ncbi:MAG TPA: patatin-like phospholipase family protein [Anaerolineae bacterium]|nr:patatin-like phospholipase family protein [Anaerolineae bacterium]
MTVAFVLSGGGNYGSLQVGALQVLLERGIRPDLLVGASAGAMNATFLAMDPTLEGLHRLAEHWRRAAHETVSRRGNLAMIWRLVTRRDGLTPNAPLQRYLERTLPPGVVCFGHLRLPTYALAVRLDTGEVRCFGDDPSDRIIDGLMATTAIPGFYPPWECDGARYVDGGVVSFLPVQMAVERGATEIYALNVSPASTRTDGLRGTLAISLRAIDLLIQGQGAREIQVYESLYGVTVHHIRLSSEHPIAFWDFRHADHLMAAGRRRTEAYLDGGGVMTKGD